MKYYKVIQENNFIGIARSIDFVRYLRRKHRFTSATEKTGELLECQGKLYRSTWMPPVPDEINNPFEQAIILEIDKEEYDALEKAVQKNEEIIIEEESEWIPPITPEAIDEDETISVAFVRDTKLKEMSYSCRMAIEAGFDIVLSDNESHHFSLDTQDQLNLMSLSIMAQTQSTVPYHADGEECIFFTAEEINQIVNAANAHKIYHTTYYNALKIYINALETIEDIAAIEYGVEIPEEYQTDVLKSL